MTSLESLVGSEWSGTCELWEDPLGDQVQRSTCRMHVTEGALQYSWSRRDKDDGEEHEHRGVIAWAGGEVSFTDSFHQAEKIACTRLHNAWGLLQAHYVYMKEWGWRIGVFFRAPTGELVIQMTNIAPWGEEARAVRMVAER
ncbi:MAG: hypothetical protein AAGA56_21345 [Myxococcota bacterium]